MVPPGFASPWHLHHAEDGAFYLAEGPMTFRCGDRRVKAGPGTWVWGPRGIPRGFRTAGDTPSRSLLLATPAGLEEFVAELSSPLPPSGPPDLGAVIAVAGRYGLDILGPLPE